MIDWGAEAYIPLPPEPLRYAVFQTINQSLLAKDRRLDRSLRHAVGA